MNGPKQFRHKKELNLTALGLGTLKAEKDGKVISASKEVTYHRRVLRPLIEIRYTPARTIYMAIALQESRRSHPCVSAFSVQGDPKSPD